MNLSVDILRLVGSALLLIPIVLLFLFFAQYNHAQGADTEALSVTCATTNTCNSPASVTFTASCTGPDCAASGPTSILDYGSAPCPPAPPKPLPSSCTNPNPGYVAPPSSPCLVATSSSTTLTATQTIYFYSAATISGSSYVYASTQATDNICAYTATSTSQVSGSAQITVDIGPGTFVEPPSTSFNKGALASYNPSSGNLGQGGACLVLEFSPTNQCVAPSPGGTSCTSTGFTNLGPCSSDPTTDCIASTYGQGGGSGEVGCFKTGYSTCSVTAVTPQSIPPGKYTYCGYDYNGDFFQSGVSMSLDTSNTFTVQSPATPTGYVEIFPTSLSGPSELIQGASANVFVELSGLTNQNPATFANNLYILYISNYSEASASLTGLTSFPCPQDGTAVFSATTPQGGSYFPCKSGDYANGNSCYTNYPVATSECDPAGDTCFIYNFTPPSIPDFSWYQVCVYYDTLGGQTPSMSSSATKLVATGNIITVSGGNGIVAPSFGLEISNAIESSGVYSKGSSLPIVVYPALGYITFNPLTPQGGICGYGDACAIEYVGLQGGNYRQDSCSAFTTMHATTTALLPSNAYCGTILEPYGGDINFPGIPQAVRCAINTYPQTASPNVGTAYTNVGGQTYTQNFNTQYLPDGDYLVCAYDYMQIPFLTDSNGNHPYYSPSFATGIIQCSNGVCSLVSTTLPYSPPTCNGQPCGVGPVTGGGIGLYQIGANGLGPFATTVCGIYGAINDIMLIFAIILMLIGAALYAGASFLPAQSQQIAKSYSFGFVLVGTIAIVIATASIWALSVAGGVPVANVLNLCNNVGVL